ncbi:MAG: DciA family protein [Roseiarcus sp.]
MSKPRGFAAPLGACLGDLLGPTLAARGLGEASLVTHWPEIVGAAIAGYARPIQLQWPPRGSKRDPDQAGAPAILVLRIDGAFALEAQHAAPTIVARVNAHLGWRCVARLAFRQGPLPALAQPRTRPPPPSARAMTTAREFAGGIQDEALREALARLGARVIDAAGR